MEREVGGGIGMGNTCKPMAVSFQCMTKFTTNKKKKKMGKKKKKRKEVVLGQLDIRMPRNEMNPFLTLYRNINSKEVIHVGVIVKTVKLLEENHYA